MSTTTSHCSVDEYFEVEFASELRHQYVDGEILEMVGGSTPHNDISSNLHVLLKLTFRKPHYRVCWENTRLRIASPVSYLFPDASVVKGECEYEPLRLDTVLNPIIVFEILSPSTERFNRGRKFELYQQIPTLAEYVLISQEAVAAERFTRQMDGTWAREAFQGMDAVMRLGSLDWDLALSELYEDVVFLTKEQS